MYDTLDIIYEGARERAAFHEAQAGSPVGLPEFSEEW